MKQLIIILTLLCSILFDNRYIIALKNNKVSFDRINQHHVICSYAIQPTSQNELNHYNEMVHNATYELKQYFKKNYDTSIKKNHHYPHRKDSVFFIHFDHKFGCWTLYKPSFVSYQDFITQAKKIYAQYGINVVFQQESMVSILKSDAGFEGECVTLQELEMYKNMDDNLFDIHMKKNKKKSSSESSVNNLSAKKMKKMKDMKKFFFWHLQIPTTGLLPGESFDIEDQYKPLAWHFLLWDLAPKKGQGAQVAIIDTGVSAFNVKEKKFADMYKQNINVYTPSNLQNYGYNLVSKNGLDPIKQLVINFGHYCDHVKFNSDDLMRQLPEWIKKFIESKDKTHIESYFMKNAKKEFLSIGDLSLNQKGSVALQDLLHGKYGILPKGSEKFFTVVNLESPYNESILLETLPAPQLTSSKNMLAAGHGTFTQGIVSGKLHDNQGIIGFAPNAHVTMIKAFHDTGTTNKTTLNSALERARILESSIVSMSLKITDTVDDIQDAPLKSLIDSFDYIVAASGNDGENLKLKNKEAYPAKFSSVAFDVGAFKYDDGKYPICSFTQKELNVGPKFVAPGFDIFSAGLTPDQKTDSMYVFMAGTSVAVPIVTGFLALVVAEFQDVFTREEILKVIYAFSIKLNKDKNWQQDTILGTIDMRSSLLCLHALQSMKKKLGSAPDKLYDFKSNFDNIVKAIHILNYYIPSCYEKQFACSLTNDFAHYVAATKIDDKNNSVQLPDFFTSDKNNTAQKNLIDVIDFITNTIVESLDEKNADELHKKLHEILFMKQYNVFAQLPEPFQNRINAALLPKNKSNPDTLMTT